MRKALDATEEPNGPLSVEAIHRLVDLDSLPGKLSIADAAQTLGVSAHTLRYYERVGLLRVPRDAHGVRVYDAAAIRRLVFLTRMRLSGMAMRDLQHYVALADAGEETVPERLDMLIEHRDTVQRQIRELQLSLAATEYKIASYGGSAGPQSCTSSPRQEES